MARILAVDAPSRIRTPPIPAASAQTDPRHFRSVNDVKPPVSAVSPYRSM